LSVSIAAKVVGSARRRRSRSASGSSAASASSRPQVEPRTARHDHAPAAAQHLVDGGLGKVGVADHRELLTRVHDAHQMMRRPGEQLAAGLVGDDRQPPVELHRVGRDDLGVERLGQGDGDLALAHAGRPEQGDHPRGGRRFSHGSRRRSIR
jgi:hypothetical protein